LKLFEKEQTQNDTFFSPFRPPADSAMTKSKLEELQRRLNQLRNLIGKENRTDKPTSAEHLARFVTLNPHAFDYAWHLEELLAQIGENDPLRDNILLAQTKLVADEQERAEELSKLHKKFQNTDGGMQALYELARLKIGLYQNESDLEQKNKYLGETRATLMSFISLYPNSVYTEQVKKILDDLPTVE
jgi:TolA-binding protein